MRRQQLFCDSEFFDVQTVWNTTTPDFPPCFQKTVIQWTPCAFLIIIAPLRLFQLSRRDVKPIPFTTLNITKIVLAIVMGAVALFDLTKAVQEMRYNNTVPMVDFVSPLILALTMVLAVVLINNERKLGVKSSGPMFIFWVLLFLAEMIIFQSKLRTALHEGKVPDHFRFTTSFLLLLLVTEEVILTLFVDHNISTMEQISCPEENASYLSRLTFGWFNSTVAQGYKKPLEKDDLFGLNPEDSSQNVISDFDKYWEEELEKQKRHNREQADKDLYNGGFMKKDVNNYLENIPQMKADDKRSQYKANLFTSILKAYWPRLLLSAAYRVVLIILQFSAPLALKHLIQFSENGEYLWRGYFYAITMFIVTCIRSILETHNGHNNECLGRRAMTAIRSLIYRKMTRLPNTGRRSCTTGEMINLLSVDTCQFADLVSSWNTFWSAPVEISIALYFMWQTLGPCVLLGTTIMAVLFPLNAYLAKFVRNYQTEQMKLKDSRMKQMNEILNGIKVLKLYAWERSFERKILNIRDKEFAVVKKMSCLNTIMSFIWSTVPIMIPLVMFAVYVLTDPDNVLTPEKVFVSLALFNILRFPMASLPRALTNLIPASISFNRLQRFMNNEELEPEAVLKCPNADNAISIKEGTFTWDRNSKASLRDINLEITDGSLVAVVGSVGAGKSSLLSALLGEMDNMYGEVTIKGSVAYVAQQAWIQNTSMQKNILFGSQFEQQKYDEIIEGCALQSDLDILPGGDKTEIGEKGINLSGGQKQRVSLARAVYQDADIYLLDDPLSAVDAHVGKHIFKEVVGHKGILKNKTRVLVTHGVSFLSKVDKIVVLVDGQISEVGSYEDLLASNGAFAEFLRTYAAEHTSSNDQQTDSSSEDSDNDHEKEKSHRSNDKSSTSSNSEVKQQGMETIIEEEALETGRVKWSVYVTYLKAVGPLTIALYVLICFLQKGITTSSDLWLSSWSENKRTGNTTTDAELRNLRLQVYGVFVVGFGFSCVALEMMKTCGAMKATKKLHRQLLRNILKSPMSFFDKTPVGRIINPFSKDIDVIDSHIPNLFASSFRVTVELVFVLAVICMKTPMFVFVLVPLIAAYLLIKKFYVRTSRQIRRIERISRSPVFSHFSESVAGISTIRAFGQQQRFIMESQNKVEELNKSVFANMVAHRWLAIRLDFLANCTIFLYSMLFAVMERGMLSAGVIGLSLTYAFDLTHIMNWLVNVSCALETEVVAVERVKEYSEHQTEAKWENRDTRPKLQWPDKGAIQFKDFGVRYREGLHLVIKGISCDIQAGEKIGIVGRTGAGKSSLTMALFRIIEKAQGSIVIDGVDISTLGLHDLRSKLTIIPQDPVLFSGSLRMNLDPFNDCTDEQLWKALKQAHLYNFVSGLADGLKHQCVEGGENLSVGQRQLICLARALLRKTKILVLDEATAAVDLEMDDLIQKTIRKEFCDCTILTIAHRLNTIMDYTRIMVLDSGKICEFDGPKNLLGDTSSAFYGMAKDAGIVS